MTHYTPAEIAPVSGWSYSASHGISSSRMQDAFNDTRALGFDEAEANCVAAWVYRTNMANRGF